MKTISLKKSKNCNFSKGVVHGFDQKFAIFASFLF